MIKVSACAIVKDEEKNLPRWLDCVKQLADEIIVVDTGSTDGTVALAEAAGAKVFHFAWIDDFAAAKNYALDQATGDWVVFPDADEYFTAEDCPKVREWIYRLHSDRRVIGLICACVNLDQARGGEVCSIVSQARVFRRLPSLRYEGAIHEALVYHGQERGEMRTVADFRLYHTGYSEDIIHHKLARNLALLLRQREEGTARPGDAYYLADCYYGAGDFAKTIQYAREAIDCKVKPAGREARPYGLLIQSLLSLRKPLAEIYLAVDEARQAYPMHGDFPVLGAIGAWQAGDYRRAEQYCRDGIACYEQTENAKEETLWGMDERRKLWPCALMYLGELDRLQGRHGEALDHFTAALARAPYQRGLALAAGRLMKEVPAVDVIAFFKSFFRLPEDVPFLLPQLLAVPLPAVCLYLDRQGGGVLAAFDRWRLADRPLLAAALAADTAAALAVAGRLSAEGAANGRLSLLLPRLKNENMAARWEAFSP